MDNPFHIATDILQACRKEVADGIDHAEIRFQIGALQLFKRAMEIGIDAAIAERQAQLAKDQAGQQDPHA